MMALKPIQWAFPALTAALLISCGGTETGHDSPGKADSLNVAQPTGDGRVLDVGGRLFSIPSPVETAMLIRRTNMPYGKELPLTLGDISRYTNSYQKAMAMGMYGADLAYVTVHKDGQRALQTLQTVEQLGGALDMNHAFDQVLADRFKRTINSEDSLLRLTGVAFRSAQEYLKTNGREDVSAWILAGGWLESMYLTVAQVDGQPDAAVAQRIAEQGRTLRSLIQLLERHSSEGPGSDLLKGLRDLQTDYDRISSKYAYVAPTVDAAAKTTWINSTTEAVVPPGTVRTISEKVRALRNNIIA